MLATAMSSDYVRTRIVRLKVSGYRSLYDVELDDLPEIVVFHGKNGTGKSNLMRVPSLVLGWAGAAPWSTFSAERPLFHDYRDASTKLGLRPTDFSNGRPPELRIEIDAQLGTASGLLISRVNHALGKLRAVARAHDIGEGITLWFETMTLDGVSLLDDAPLPDLTGDKRPFLERLRQVLRRQGLILRQHAYRGLIREPLEQGSADQSQSFQRRMLAVHVHPDLERRRQLIRLGRRLSEMGVFPGSSEVQLSPAEDPVFNECRLIVAVPGVGDVPLENLGTGQQQLIMMAADALVERRPIVQIEEPEAHLHAELMEIFARFLRTEVEEASLQSPIDQAWISTHHHAFAIAPEYFEVQRDPTLGTTVQRRDRAEAVKHFYEPGPLWEALRSFASSTSRETVVMHDHHGQPVTAGAILDSVEGDRELADQFAASATRTIVGRFRKHPVEAR